MWRLSGLLIFGFVGTLGCSSSAPAPDPGPSACSDEAGYQFDVVDRFDVAQDGFSVYVSRDLTVGGSIVADVETIPDGARCGSTAALVVRSSGFDDWGSLFGLASSDPRDETAYEGIWFWARSPGDTNEKFTLFLDDSNTYPSPGGVGYCQIGTDGNGGPVVIDPLTDQVLGSSSSFSPGPGQCGNSYRVSLMVTREWRIYSIPFSQFQQLNQPNRVPNSILTHVGPVPGTALLTGALGSISFRIPTKSQTELWIDDLAFYRKKAVVPGADAASDAN